MQCPSTGYRLSGIFTQAPAPTLSWFTGRFKQQVYQWTKFSLVRQFTWTWIYWSIFILYRLLTISIVPMKVIPEYFYRNVLEVMLEYNLANLGWSENYSLSCPVKTTCLYLHLAPRGWLCSINTSQRHGSSLLLLKCFPLINHHIISGN